MRELPDGVRREVANATDPAETKSLIDRIVDGGYFENYGALTALELARAAEAALSAEKPHVKLVVLMISSDPDLAKAHTLVRIHEPKDGKECLVSSTERERETLARYKAAMRGARSLAERARRLARLRSEEGYMAECIAKPDGAMLLVENHCPVCAAAQTCQGLCRSELEIFRAVLSGAAVERADHILAGARRCAYRIEPRRSANRPGA